MPAPIYRLCRSWMSWDPEYPTREHYCQTREQAVARAETAIRDGEILWYVLIEPPSEQGGVGWVDAMTYWFNEQGDRVLGVVYAKGDH